MSNKITRPLPKGSVVEFCGERATVVEDRGDRLTVVDDDFTVMKWQWRIYGEECTVVSVPAVESEGTA